MPCMLHRLGGARPLLLGVGCSTTAHVSSFPFCVYCVSLVRVAFAIICRFVACVAVIKVPIAAVFLSHLNITPVVWLYTDLSHSADFNLIMVQTADMSYNTRVSSALYITHVIHGTVIPQFTGAPFTVSPSYRASFCFPKYRVYT